MRIQYYEQALHEMIEGIDYYSGIDTTLGKYFYRDVNQSISVLKRFPRIGKKHFKYPHLRIINCQKFPYSLIYHYGEDENTIYILAVAHQKQQPGYWEKRL